MDEKFIKDLMARVEDNKLSEVVHTPYREMRNREPDLKVEYNLNMAPELSDSKPSQGMRCSFVYEGDDPVVDGTYSFAVELLNKDGTVVQDKRLSIADQGNAYMWFADDVNRKEVHQKRMKVGVKGCWVVGPYELASFTVVEIIGLNSK